MPSSSTSHGVTNLPQNLSWQIQYTGKIDTNLDVSVHNLDLSDVSTEVIQALKERHIFIMCYFNAGAFEDWPPDAELKP